MAPLGRGGKVLKALAVALFSPAPALAIRPHTWGWSHLTSPGGRFLVHYEPGVPTSDAEAAAVNFDSAYAREVGAWGFPAPRPDDDGPIDVYVTPTGAGKRRMGRRGRRGNPPHGSSPTGPCPSGRSTAVANEQFSFDRATAHLEAALAAHEGLGGSDWQERFETLMELGLTQHRGGSVDAGAETFSVAQLAAHGKANSEIAQLLTLGNRTVETHLTSAYRKLGIARRAQLPEALESEPRVRI